MNNVRFSVQSLYDLTLKELCRSMDEDILVHVLKYYPPSIVLQVIWKILHVNNESPEFEFGHLSNGMLSSVQRGCEIAQMSIRHQGYLDPIAFRQITYTNHEEFAKDQQTKFINGCNFCNHFDLDLFFKLVEITESRSKLFTIFQICIQIKGFKFPQQFAEKWIQTQILEDHNENIHFHHIEQGLKLGIFLGDSGWLKESALVLSHTYKIISTKWVCLDRNLELIKNIQCLTKWLLVVSNYHDFDEAKVVLQHILNTISVLEKIEGRTLCISYAYIAVSQYYYVLIEYNEAWVWAVKAVNELHDKSADFLKLLVISHVIKVCSVLNKLSMAKKLIDQVYTYDKEIDQNIHVDMLMNEACYSLKADLAKDSITSYYTALDSRRNLFGYYNLHTAVVFVDYAYARYVCDYSTFDFSEAMRSILQGIFIMNKIGIPQDNMLLVNAGRIRALILEEKALDIINSFDNYTQDPLDSTQAEGVKQILINIKDEMLTEAETLHFKALDVSLNAVGEKALLTAKSYCNLGRLYQSQGKFSQSEKMHLKAIEIKESILGVNHPDVALSLGHLASLYTYQLKKYHEAELLYLRSKTIYETTYGHQYTGLLYDIQGLAQVYRALNNMDKFNQYMECMHIFHETREAWLYQIHTAVDKNCRQDDLSLEKFKCILNDCGCEK